MEDLKTSDVPLREGWVECELGEIGYVISGGTPKTSILEYWSNDIPWITPADLSKYESKYISKGRKSISKIGLEKSSAKLMPASSVLFSSRAPVGYVVIARNELCTNQGFKSIVPNKRVNSEYIYYYLKSIKNIADENASGTTFKELSAKAFSKLPFQLPSLPEQRAIVSKIEQLISELDNGVSNLKAARDKLEIYRQAVLKKAFEGELTGTKLSETILGEVVEKPKYGTSKKCSYDIDGVPVVRIPNIIKGKVSHDDLKYGIFNKEEGEKYSIQKGDLLTIRSNGSVDLVGRCAVATEDDTNCFFAGYLIRLRPQKEMIDSKYLFYCLESHKLRVQIEKKAKSTSGVNNINSEELSNLKIPICSPEEQKQIVTEIESRLSVCDNIKAVIDESLEQAEALRQSILKKAFEGRLLSAEELRACRKEPDWEPAEKLLERIKSENKAGKKK